MGFDEKGVLAVALVFLLAFGIWQYAGNEALPGFSEAMKIQAALAGKSAPLHSQAAADALQLFAAISGTAASSPGTIVSFLLFFPSLLLACSAALVYLALRALSHRRTVAAFVSLLFAFSLAASAFLPGDYSADALSAFLFSAFLFVFSSYLADKRPLLLVLAAPLAALSSYVAPAFGAAGVAVAASFAASAFLRNQKETLPLLALALAAAVPALLSPQAPSLFLDAPRVQSLFAGSPFLVAAASCAFVLSLAGKAGREYLFLTLLSPPVAAFSPLAATLCLVLSAGEGVSSALAGITSRRAALACIFLAAFFASFGLMLPLADAYKSAVVAAMASSLIALLLHMYEYRTSQAFSLLFLCMFILSASGVFFYSLSSGYPAYSDSDLSAALSYLSARGAGTVFLLGSADAARFYLPRASLGPQGALSSYLLEGKGLLQQGYVVLSLSYLDSPDRLYSKGSPGFSALAYRGNFSSGGAAFALFSSQDGILMARELDPSGSFALKDALLLDSAGQSYGSFPLSRLLLLRPDRGISDRSNRLIALEESSLPPYFMRIYSNESNLAQVAEFGTASVYQVK